MCREIPGIVYKVIDIDDDRICALQVLKDQFVVLTIIGVYMPFFNGDNAQIQLYVETLDRLQATLDMYSEGPPCIIMGDFNASLPQKDTLSVNWYKIRPFNCHSLLLFDFLVNNDLVVADFQFKQCVNYTYFKGLCKTYIDHCFVTKQTHNLINYCKIIDDMCDNVSDHLPVSISVNIPWNGISAVYGNKYEHCEENIDWNNCNFKAEYRHRIAILLENIVLPRCDDGDIHNFSTVEQVQAFVDKYSDVISGTLHEAASSSLKAIVKSQPGNNRPKHWWNKDCKIARDRNRFWYSLWRSCGRPHHGVIYDSYKYAKQVFRNVCRKAVNDTVAFNFKKCDMLFKYNRIGRFWNRIRRARNPQSSNCNHITIQSLEEHFSNKFSYQRDHENVFIADARQKVESKLLKCPFEYEDFVFTEHKLAAYIRQLKPGGAPGADLIRPEHVKLACGSNIVAHLCKLFSYCFKYGIVLIMVF